MHVLEHAPVAFLGSLVQHDICIFFLTLTHGNIGQSAGFDCLVVSKANLLNIRCWIYTREQHEEGCSAWLGFSVQVKYVERWLFNELGAEPLSDILDQSTSKPIRSHGSEQEKSVEERTVFESAR